MRYGLISQDKGCGILYTAEIPHKGMASLEVQIKERRERGVKLRIGLFSHVVFNAIL